ncbi:MAG: AI-2E family transporter [Elusimicrobia bacterium]|nr:AI-2E family transporter [Elusimicrobiota bacterium]
MNREQLFRYFFLGVFLFLIFQVLHILSPFYTGILGAVVLTLIFYPLHHMILEKAGKDRPNLASSLSTLLVLILIVVPFLFFSWLLFNELKTLSPEVKRLSGALQQLNRGDLFLDMPWLHQWEIRMEGILNIFQVDFQEVFLNFTTNLLDKISALSRKLPKNAFLFIVNFFVMVFTLFFLFRDGPNLFSKAKELIPLDERHKDMIARQIYLTLTAVVRGVFVVAIVQGFAAGVGFAIARVPSPAILGFTTMFTALIPLVGSPAIWLPVSLYYLVQGVLGKGIFLLIWGILVVSTIDNFIRPIVIGTRAKLPILFLFFGLLGGVKIYGPLGIFLGPLVIGLLIAFIRIYREEYPLAKKSEQDKT